MPPQRPYLYLRGLRVVDHTVFSVSDGQKTYYDPVFGQRLPFSSGQQVKRTILDHLADVLGEGRASITFNWQLTPDPKEPKNRDKGKLEQKEPWSPCDPTYADQLIGGWMRAQSSERTIKRRSPLSISAMHPLHPTLAGTSTESLTFDRSDRPEQHKIIVRDEKGNIIPHDEVKDFLDANNRSLPMRIWIPEDKVGRRATGLFIYDIAIDLRLLFSVSLNDYDPELTPKTREALEGAGWKRSSDNMYLVCPKKRRDQIIPALAESLIHWHISSNQARTYSPQNTLAIAISEKANRIGSAIRADLSGENPDRPRAEPVLASIDGVDLYTALPALGYVREAVGDANALDKAEAALRERLSAFDYDNVTFSPNRFPASATTREAPATSETLSL